MNNPDASIGSVIDALLPPDVKVFAGQVTTWAKSFGTLLLDKLKGGMVFVAHTSIDPFLASLLEIKTWQAALTAVAGPAQKISQIILDLMFPVPKPGDISKAPQNVTAATNSLECYTRRSKDGYGRSSRRRSCIR